MPKKSAEQVNRNSTLVSFPETEKWAKKKRGNCLLLWEHSSAVCFSVRLPSSSLFLSAHAHPTRGVRRSSLQAIGGELPDDPKGENRWRLSLTPVSGAEHNVVAAVTHLRILSSPAGSSGSSVPRRPVTVRTVLAGGAGQRRYSIASATSAPCSDPNVLSYRYRALGSQLLGRES